MKKVVLPLIATLAFSNQTMADDGLVFSPAVNVAQASSSMEFNRKEASASYTMAGFSLLLAGETIYSKWEFNIGGDTFDGSPAHMNPVNHIMTEDEVYFLDVNLNGGHGGMPDDNGHGPHMFNHIDTSFSIGGQVHDNIDVFAGYRIAIKEFGEGTAFENSGPFAGVTLSTALSQSLSAALSVAAAKLEASMDREPFDDITSEAIGLSTNLILNYAINESMGLITKFKFESFDYDVSDDRFSNQTYSQVESIAPQYVDSLRKLDVGSSIVETNSIFQVSLYYQF